MRHKLEKYRWFADPLTEFFENCIRVTQKGYSFISTVELIDAAKKYYNDEDRQEPDRASVIRYMERRGYERTQRRLNFKRIRGYEQLHINEYEENDVPF